MTSLQLGMKPKQFVWAFLLGLLLSLAGADDLVIEEALREVSHLTSYFVEESWTVALLRSVVCLRLIYAGY